MYNFSYELNKSFSVSCKIENFKSPMQDLNMKIQGSVANGGSVILFLTQITIMIISYYYGDYLK